MTETVTMTSQKETSQANKYTTPSTVLHFALSVELQQLQLQTLCEKRVRSRAEQGVCSEPRGATHTVKTMLETV